MQEQKRPSKGEEAIFGVIAFVIITIFIVIGVVMTGWLISIFHTEGWLMYILTFIGTMMLSFLILNKIGKAFGIDVAKDLGAGEYGFASP